MAAEPQSRRTLKPLSIMVSKQGAVENKSLEKLKKATQEVIMSFDRSDTSSLASR